MRHSLTLAFVAAFAFGCTAPAEKTASAPESKAAPQAPASAPAAEKKNCEPPPKELVVKDLEPGTGQAVRFRSAVLVGYTGWLYDDCAPDHKGKEFDSSKNRPTPFGFMVGAGRVIKGWDEGLIGMKEKGKRLLVIPPDKAYGNRAVGDVIKPNSTLVFEVDLVQIINQPGEPK